VYVQCNSNLVETKQGKAFVKKFQLYENCALLCKFLFDVQGDSEISLEKNPVIADDEKKSQTKKILIKVFSFSRYK
jgi:hypothetical protein